MILPFGDRVNGLSLAAIDQRNTDNTGDLLDLGDLLALLFTQTDLANHFGMGFQLDLRGQGVLQIQLLQNSFHNVEIFGGFQLNNQGFGTLWQRDCDQLKPEEIFAHKSKIDLYKEGKKGKIK